MDSCWIPRCALLFLLLVPGAGPRADIPRFPSPLGLQTGMRLEQAREVLTARGCSVKVHDDDKPVRGASHKLRAS